jgi:hypothetical protein
MRPVRIERVLVASRNFVPSRSLVEPHDLSRRKKVADYGENDEKI